MEFVHNMIHTECTKAKGCLQLPVEEDKNIPDSLPDLTKVCLSKATLEIKEIRPYTDYVLVHGEIAYEVLCHAQEAPCGLFCLSGSIPLEEKINMAGTAATDHVQVKGELEDFRVRMIHSRKLSIQTVVTLQAEVKELKDTRLLIETTGEEQVEGEKKEVSYTKLKVAKRDVYRIKEELQLPASYPNIEMPLWSNVRIGELEYALSEDKITLSGELQIFFLYQGEGDDKLVRSYEKWIPVKGSVDCPGITEEDIAYLTITPGQTQVGARPDMDGEQRSIYADVTLDLDIHIYEEESREVITDLYSISHELLPAYEEEVLQQLKGKRRGKMKLSEKTGVSAGADGLLQVVYSAGKLWQESAELTEEGILVKGSVVVTVLYVTREDQSPYGSETVQVPFRYVLQMEGLDQDDTFQIEGRIEALEVSLQGDNEMEIRGVLCFDAIVMEEKKMSCMTHVGVAALDQEKIRTLPSMCIYVVSAGDTLWEIGKKYHTTQKEIMELNHLNSTELKTGQKLLLCKSC